MIIWPMVFRGRAVELRDAQWIAMNMFLDWTRYTNMRPTELSSYTPQTVQGIVNGKLLWSHSISFLMITDRNIDFNTIMLKVIDRYLAILDLSENRTLAPEDHALLKEFPFEDVQSAQATGNPALPPAPIMPRTEEQDRLNVQAQNSRSAKIGAKGTFTYEEWLIMRGHFGDICGRCKTPLARPVMDHVIPLSRGGTNYIENIQTLCRDCNSGKNAKSIDYRDPDLVLSFLEKLEEYRKSS